MKALLVLLPALAAGMVGYGYTAYCRSRLSPEVRELLAQAQDDGADVIPTAVEGAVNAFGRDMLRYGLTPGRFGFLRVTLVPKRSPVFEPHSPGLCVSDPLYVGNLALTRGGVVALSQDLVGMADVRRKWIIYHELGHCLLGLGHAPSGTFDIMNPVVPRDLSLMAARWPEVVAKLMARADPWDLGY